MLNNIDEIKETYELRIMDEAHRQIFNSKAEKYVGELLQLVEQQQEIINKLKNVKTNCVNQTLPSLYNPW